MFERFARTMYRRRWYVLAIWALVLVAGMAGASQVNSVLGPGDFQIAGSDSARADTLLNLKFHQNAQNLTFVVNYSPALTTRDPAFRRTVAGIAARARADTGLAVGNLDNPLVSGNRQLIGRDGHSAAIMLASNLSEADIEGQIAHLRQIVRTPGFTTYVTGTAASNYDYAQSSKDDLAKGEAITVPMLILILVLVFGSAVAVSLPVLLAASSIVLSLALVYVFGHFITTSVYVTNVVSALGLGIGIDYSLFIVYRFREELRASNNHVETAVVRTMTSTGRAVFFSGLTVAIGLSSLILTGVSFMQSMGLGGVLVPFTALLVAMTVLPAMLGVLGPRVNRFRVLPTRFLQTGEGNGPWHRLATGIMRRPVVTGGVALAILVALAFPLTHLNLAFGSLKNAPQSLDSVAGIQFMQKNLPAQTDPTQIVIAHHGPGSLLDASQVAAMRALQRTADRNPEALRANGPADFLGNGTPSGGATLAGLNRYVSPDRQTAVISVIPRHDVGTTGAERLVRDMRTLASSPGSGLRNDVVTVGGAQADYTDWNDALYSKFPYIVGLVLILTYGFLFFAFRSVFLPLKAVLLNLLSVAAAYGALQLVFQRGIGHDLLAFSPESGVAGWVPVFLFAFLFGLSMDYEVLLLSRVREEWLDSGDNTHAVAMGLEKTGRLISSAAAIMVVAFSGFLIGHQIQLKEFGFGLVSSIAVDATLIRVILVPSIMALMGNANWWVPSRLRSWASSSGLGEGDVLPIVPLDEREPEVAGV